MGRQGRQRPQTRYLTNSAGLGRLRRRHGHGPRRSVPRIVSKRPQNKKRDHPLPSFPETTSRDPRAIAATPLRTQVRDLDDITFTEWFTSFGGSRGSIDRMWDPIAYALGFIDCDHISARCMLTIFMLFAIRTEASVLRMLDGSPQTYLHDPIVKYLEERGVKINLRTGIRDIVYETDASGKPCKVTGLQVQSELKEFDAVVAAVDLPGAKKLIPEPFRVYPEFDRIYELDAVPIATVQLRFDGS